MSVLQQMQTTAEGAIHELEAEIVDLEEMIEAHRQRIQGARVQIQALNMFLNPEEKGKGMLDNGALTGAVLETITELYPQSVHYRDLSDLIIQKGYEIAGKQPEKTVLNCLFKLTKAGKAKSSGKGYYEAIDGIEEEV